MTAKVRDEDPDDPTPSIPLAGAVILLQAITAGYALRHHNYLFGALMLAGAVMWSAAVLMYVGRGGLEAFEMKEEQT